MKILYIAVDELPKGCGDCVNITCSLPLKKGVNADILKKYEFKRHEYCPLKVIQE